jgi:Ca2+-binding RTX toxin-like protein
MPTTRAVTSLTVLALLAAAVLGATLAVASTSHEGWPTIDGKLKMHKADENGSIRGTSRNDELLGGHGNDTIWGRNGHDVIWGDYKPGGQPTSQVDHLNGGAGNEFIYASHGRNIIAAGPGNDTIHAHFGRGSIDCGPGVDTLFISHRSRKGYKISHCEKISYKTLGY